MQKNTEISERIMELIDFVGDSKNEFAKKLGYERSQSIYDITNGKSKPSFDFFERLLISEYSEIINIEYIITGRGSIDKTKSEEKVTLSKGNLKGNQKSNKPNVEKRLPYENTDISLALKAKDELIANLTEQIKDLKQDKERAYQDRDNWEQRYNLAQSEIRQLKNVSNLGDSKTLMG